MIDSVKQDQRSTAVPGFPLYHSVNQWTVIPEMAKNDPFMVLTWSLKLALPESYSMSPWMIHTKFHNSVYIPYSPFPRNGQNMALLFLTYVPHMVLQIFFPESYSMCLGRIHAKFH